MTTSSYVRPDTLPELLAVLADLGDRARIVAGGTDLWIHVRAGRTWPALVNVSRVEEMRHLAVRDGVLDIGACTTVTALLRSDDVRTRAPLLWHAADHFASPLVRSRATVGGNLCNASPAADLTLALLAHDAEVVVASAAGTRSLPVHEFVLGPGRTALVPGEAVVGVRVPLRTDARAHHFEKSGPRPALEIAVVAVAAAVTVEGGRASDARIACGAVAPVPMRCRGAEALLEGRPLDDDTIGAASRAAALEVRPIDDVRASIVHRRRLVAAFVRRALVAARDSRRSAHVA